MTAKTSNKESKPRVFVSPETTGRTYPRLKGQKRIDKQLRQQRASREKKGLAW